jgi:hypothetical protein
MVRRSSCGRGDRGKCDLSCVSRISGSDPCNGATSSVPRSHPKVPTETHLSTGHQGVPG